MWGAGAAFGRIDRRVFVIASGVGVMLISLAVGLVLWPREQPSICEPVFPILDAKGLDLAYLRDHSRHTQGSIPLDGAQVTGLYKSDDPRNFAAEVSVAEFSHASGQPVTNAQNPFFGRDALYRAHPGRRVVLIFSYGDFEWRFTGSLAPDPGLKRGLQWPYHLGVGALDATTGSLIFEQYPACK